MLKIGDKVEVKNGMTGKPSYVGEVLKISMTGKRVEISHPRYATGKAVFYNRGYYVESYGGVSPTNDFFRVEA